MEGVPAFGRGLGLETLALKVSANTNHSVTLRLYDMIKKKSTHCCLWREEPGTGCRLVNLRRGFLYLEGHLLTVIYKV